MPAWTPWPAANARTASKIGVDAIGDSLPFLFVGVVLFVLAGIAERRRRMLGPAGSASLRRAPLVIALCGVVDILLAIVMRTV
jgi:hypothetical protein